MIAMESFRVNTTERYVTTTPVTTTVRIKMRSSINAAAGATKKKKSMCRFFSSLASEHRSF
jgi:hypothetical protein